MKRNNSVLSRLKSKEKELIKEDETFFGYPSNAAFNYKELFKFLKFPLNNVGDPFLDSSYQLSTRDFEREVLSFFAKLYKIPKSIFWGYVTSGGTEGNMYGIFLGRELYPKGRLYFSEDSHYSIRKIARVLNMKFSVVGSLNSLGDWGEMDTSHLEKLLTRYKKNPPIISLNIGTTMKGGIDNLKKVCAILKKLKIKDFHLHCDAALFGMILPFLKKSPKIDFTLPISSLAISGHKFIGSPIPCGVVLTKKEFVKKVENKVEYIRTIDTTISGSRNGFTPLILWYAIKTRGLVGFRKEVKECMRNADYLYCRLKEINYPARLNDFSNTIVIKKPKSEQFLKKWELAVQGEYAHIVVMQHVTKHKIDKFILELKKIHN